MDVEDDVVELLMELEWLVLVEDVVVVIERVSRKARELVTSGATEGSKCMRGRRQSFDC